MPKTNPKFAKKGTKDQDEKTYDCHECGVTFSCRQSLFRHRSERHGTVTYKCPVCIYKNFRPIRILEHAKRLHPNLNITKDDLVRSEQTPATTEKMGKPVPQKRKRICQIVYSDDEESDPKRNSPVMRSSQGGEVDKARASDADEEVSFSGGCTPILNIPALDSSEEISVEVRVNQATSSCQTDGVYKTKNATCQTGSKGTKMKSVACQTDFYRYKGVNESTQVTQAKAITRLLTYEDGSTETIHEAIWSDDKEKHIAEYVEPEAEEDEDEEEEYNPIDDAELDRKLNELYHPTKKVAVVSPLKPRNQLEDITNIFETESDLEE